MQTIVEQLMLARKTMATITEAAQKRERRMREYRARSAKIAALTTDQRRKRMDNITCGVLGCMHRGIQRQESIMAELEISIREYRKAIAILVEQDKIEHKHGRPYKIKQRAKHTSRNGGQ